VLIEVIIPMSISEEHANSSWNLPAINTAFAEGGKNLLTEVGMAPINEEWTFLFKYSVANIS
jgi:hypothetical protein